MMLFRVIRVIQCSLWKEGTRHGIHSGNDIHRGILQQKPFYHLLLGLCIRRFNLKRTCPFNFYSCPKTKTKEQPKYLLFTSQTFRQLRKRVFFPLVSLKVCQLSCEQCSRSRSFSTNFIKKKVQSSKLWASLVYTAWLNSNFRFVLLCTLKQSQQRSPLLTLVEGRSIFGKQKRFRILLPFSRKISCFVWVLGNTCQSVFQVQNPVLVPMPN